mgnify:CR=1 FL=1
MLSIPSWQVARSKVKSISTRYLEPYIVKPFILVGLTPNMVTMLGVIMHIPACYMISRGDFLVGGILLLGAAAFDMVDGAVARHSGKSSATGALLDSIADRISEALCLIGLLWFYLGSDSAIFVEVLLVFLTMFTSSMVSYIRARGEGLDVDCTVGIMTRPERVVVLAFGLMLHQVVFAMMVIVSLSMLTAVHRFWHIKREISST